MQTTGTRHKITRPYHPGLSAVRESVSPFCVTDGSIRISNSFRCLNWELCSAVVRTEAATVVASSRSELLEAVEKALVGCFTEAEQEAEQSIKLEGVALPAVVLHHVGRHPGVARAELVRQLVELYNRPSGVCLEQYQT